MRRTNPWWDAKPLPPLPPLRRWLFPTLLKRLQRGLTPAVALRGARQVGKTTLLNHVIEALLQQGVAPRRIFRIQFDEIPALRGLQQPLLSLCYWYEQQVLGMSFNEAARAGEPAYIFLDEAQNLPDWSVQLKALVDHAGVRVLLTGSSALRIEQGRESLAGRITTLEIGGLLLREIAALHRLGTIPALLPENGWGELRRQEFWQELRALGAQYAEVREAAFQLFAARGGYPVAHREAEVEWGEIAAYLNETVVRRVIVHDLRISERGRRRDQSLLEALFTLACRYAGQTPSIAVYAQELRAALRANVGPQRILAYLRFLNDSLLIRLIRPLELRLKRRRGNPKVCLCDHSLRASWLQEVPPLTAEALRAEPELGALAGHIAESITGYFLASMPEVNLAWFPERSVEPEVDFVLTIGETRIPIEVKYRQRIDPHRDTLGLRAFIEKTANNAPFGVLITLSEAEVADPRIVALPLSSLLLLR
ncbi:MAG: AAA family ATPase [Fimbriimonadales bacterium]|nr:AAA family ATPase [Fimbriimonadales bacterium]